jgi:hypothetical protein
MCTAIGIGAILLGGWVLASPPREGNVAAPAASAPAVAPQTAPSPLAMPAVPSAAQGSTTTPQNGTQRAALADQQGRRGVMPLTPTEPAEPGAPGTPGILAPTQQAPTGVPAGGLAGMPPSGLPGEGGMMPMAPTYRSVRPSASGALPPTYNAFDQQQSQLTASKVPQKAFANYQPPPSGVSPYMNLYRTDTNGGTIDNYTTLVRPQLQQQNVNQQFDKDIFGLQRAERLQNAALQRVDRNTRNLQGVSTPQYFMNSGGYYPYYAQPNGQ